VKTQRVHLLPHDPRWGDEFARESAIVANALGGVLVAIHHMGSTAIPGIYAKPIIDMLAVTEDIRLLDEHGARLEALGYEALGEFGIPGRRYFRKSNAAGERTHQIHSFQADSLEVTRHLAFCAYLRAHPEAAREYEALKLRLAEAHPEDINLYTEGKGALIRDIDVRAAAWFSSRG
jgi:GrpB-like predicted nucleotidyltransferase (UPF0157 family)